MSSLREQKAERKRYDILSAAARCFKRCGYHPTTMEQIAAELLMTPGSLYYYFKSKEELLFGCHVHSLERLLLVLEEVRAADASEASKLRTLVEAPVGLGIDELQAASMALEFEILSDPYRSRLIALRDEFERGVRETIRAGIDGGEFLEVDERLVGFAIFGAINGIATWFDAAGQRPLDEVGRCFSELFLRALGVDPETVEPVALDR